jgi:hypothetical protein
MAATATVPSIVYLFLLRDWIENYRTDRSNEGYLQHGSFEHAFSDRLCHRLSKGNGTDAILLRSIGFDGQGAEDRVPFCLFVEGSY